MYLPNSRLDYKRLAQVATHLPPPAPGSRGRQLNRATAFEAKRRQKAFVYIIHPMVRSDILFSRAPHEVDYFRRLLQVIHCFGP